MTNEVITQLLEEEFKSPTLAVTKQYLEVHRPVYINGELSISRIDRERKDGIVVAYLPVESESFNFAVYIDSQAGKIVGFGTEGNHRVYFSATSDVHTAADLRAMTHLSFMEFWNKGDLNKAGSARNKYSHIKIVPNPEPDDFEDKLIKLLDYLEQDKEGIKELVEKANGYIQVAMHLHNANGMIGGANLSADCIRRMSNLGLAIDFDLYVAGNSFKE